MSEKEEKSKIHVALAGGKKTTIDVPAISLDWEKGADAVNKEVHQQVVAVVTEALVGNMRPDDKSEYAEAARKQTAATLRPIVNMDGELKKAVAGKMFGLKDDRPDMLTEINIDVQRDLAANTHRFVENFGRDFAKRVQVQEQQAAFRALHESTPAVDTSGVGDAEIMSRAKSRP